MAGRKTPPAATGTLTALLSSNAAHARSFTPSDDQLARWYEQQVTAVRNHVAALAEAMLTASVSKDDPAGEREFYHLDARYHYNFDTLCLLRACDFHSAHAGEGHVLSCPNHGPFGCGAGLSEDEATALAWRGYLDQEKNPKANKLGWQRHCEVCAAAQIEAEGERLFREAQR